MAVRERERERERFEGNGAREEVRWEEILASIKDEV